MARWRQARAGRLSNLGRSADQRTRTRSDRGVFGVYSFCAVSSCTRCIFERWSQTDRQRGPHADEEINLHGCGGYWSSRWREFRAEG